MKIYVAAITLGLCFVAFVPYRGFSETPQPIPEARRWVDAKFLGKTDAQPSAGYLLVYTKDGQLLRNRIGGSPLRIGADQFERGLNFSSGKIEVHLPRAAKSFSAVIGGDSNRDDRGYAGKGNYLLSVSAKGGELFRSGVLHEGVAGVPIEVKLAGVNEFTLELTPVGERKTWDSPKWDQADWANARVTLEDGSTLWLSDLPIGPLPSPYSTEPPFSFRYGDKPSSELLKVWELKRSARELDSNRTEYTEIYSDPRTGLVVRCVAVEYHDFPAVEWTLYLHNGGKRATPILEQIQAIDTQFERSEEGEFLLHHGKGSTASPTDYEPLETELARKADLRITTSGGRPTNSDLCYFNLEWPPRQGVIVALGWPGQWAADFQRDEGTALRVQAGQELTHFKLLPGEEVRTPLVALVFWKGDWIDGQNTWRRWMVAHNVPRQGGKLPPPQLDAETDIITNIMLDATEANQKALIDRYVEERIPLDYWWMDAGWYKFNKQWFGTGTWEVDTERFPHGLRAITDYLHTKNIKSIVWFEPERVTPGTWLYENHPEWLLTAPSSDKRTYDRGWKLLNLGNPDAWQWVSNHINNIINEQGIDLYRQDFNINPLSFWRANDAPDRQGITEIKYVEGYLAYFDFLRSHHPDMLIDTCASGGRRNDLETLRRAVPLWRSDYDFEPVPMQNITYGIDLWIPYFGTGLHRLDPYSFRSDMCPATVLQLDVRRKDLNYDALRTLCAQWRHFADFYYGDYYPLTSYSTQDDTWMALQFNRPEKGDGAVEVFRRPDSPFEAARFKLRGLDSAAQYTISNLDGSNTTQISGQELIEKGLPVTIKEEPGSALFVYERSK